MIPGFQYDLGKELRMLRGKAVLQPGYISGETIVDLWNPQIFMTLSRWASVDAWQRWEGNPERQQVINRINGLLQGRAIVRMWNEGDDHPPVAM